MKRTVILFSCLAALLLASVSCGDGRLPDSGNSDAAVIPETAAVTETESVEEFPLDLPKDLTFDGQEVRILDYLHNISGIALGNENDTDVDSSVLDAIYTRNLAVEDLLGIRFRFINEDYNNIAGLARNSILSDSDDYDMIFNMADFSVSLFNSGYFRPLSELPYINLDEPWWFRSYMESVSLNSREPYILFGDISHTSTERIFSVFFNKEMLSELKDISDEDLYQTVLDGKWTFDYFLSLCKDVYQDRNGDNIPNMGDRFAFINGHKVDYIAFSVGLSFTDRDKDGYPVLAMNNERSVQLADKLLSLSYHPDILSDVDDDYLQPFANGETLFTVQRFFSCSWANMRAMKEDFGIVPVPKFDEDTEYHSITGRYVGWGGVPITAQNIDCISAAAEAMGYYGRKDVFPVYYESALKVKYARDDMTAKMIDLIRENSRTDFLYMNNVGSLGTIFESVVKSGSNTFESSYQKNEKKALKNLDKLKAELETDRG